MKSKSLLGWVFDENIRWDHIIKKKKQKTLVMINWMSGTRVKGTSTVTGSIN